MAKIYSGSESDLFFLAEVLRRGELVAVPTETVYGLAAHALDAAACEHIFRVKERPAHDPLIVHVASREAAEPLAVFTPLAEKLAGAFWPGALTLVLAKKPSVPAIVTAGLNSLAIRVPAHPVLQALLQTSGLPLAAPSANLFGYVSPTTSAHVTAGLGDRIAHILEGGPCAIGVESTIIDARNVTRLVLLRPGGIPREAIERVAGCPVHTLSSPAGDTIDKPTKAALAPGMLDRHYSPRTPLELRERAFATSSAGADTPDRIARVFFQKPADGHRTNDDHWLTEDGNLAEAAQRLFALIRELDHAGYHRIVVEPAPDEGLGVAINDRLRRAAAKR